MRWQQVVAGLSTPQRGRDRYLAAAWPEVEREALEEAPWAPSPRTSPALSCPSLALLPSPANWLPTLYFAAQHLSRLQTVLLPPPTTPHFLISTSIRLSKGSRPSQP